MEEAPIVQHEEKSETGGMLKVIAISIGHMAHDIFGTMISTLLPVYIDRFSISTLTASIMPVVVRVPSILQPVFGRIADRKEVRWILILWPSVTALTLTLTGVVDSLAAVVILLFGTGLNAAIFHSVAGAAAGKFAGESIGKGIGLWMIGARIGSAIAPVLAVFVISRFSVAGLPLLMALSIAASIFLYTQFHNEPLYLSTTTQSVPFLDAWKTVKPIMLPLLVSSGLQSFLTILYMTYLPTFLTQNGQPLWIAGISLSLYSLIGIPASYIGGSLSDKLGLRRIYIFSVFTTLILNFASLLTGGWLSLALTIMVGFSMALISPIPMSIAQASFPEMRSYANGMYVGMNFFLRSIALIVVGYLTDLFGMRVLYAVFAVFYLLGLPIILYKLPQGRKRQPAA